MDDELFTWISELATAEACDLQPVDETLLWRLLAEPDVWFGALSDFEAGKVVSHVAQTALPPVLERAGERRQAWLDLIYRFFEHGLVPRCGDHLGHRGEGTQLSGACYMFFDLLGLESCIQGELALALYARILALPSLAAQEAALHGLGHFAGDTYHPGVAAIIDAATIGDQLQVYAEAARSGSVL